MEFKYSKNLKYLILAFGGVMLMCLSYLIHAFNPLELIVDKVLTLSEGSILFGFWTKPPYEILIKAYIFNVTNPEEFLSGKEKLRFQEVGPYVLQEVLVNGRGRFNDNGTLTFEPTRDFLNRPDLSVGDIMKDRIISPNIPMLAITSVLSEYGVFLNFGLSSLLTMHKMKEFMNLTVNEYLWGYEDSLVSLANTFIPNWIDFKKFGILDRLLAVDNASNIVTITLNEKTTTKLEGVLETIETKLPYSVHRYNGSPGLKHWGYEDQVGNETHEGNGKCNTVEGSYDGGLFPRHLKENTTLMLYRRAFCRPVDIKYESTGVDENGFEAYNYRVYDKFLASPEENPDNACYCYKGECLPSGFASLAPCYYKFPIVISQPHYYNADPKIAQQIDGLHPEKEKHDTTVQINPNLGIPLKAELRIQINLKVSKKQYSAKTRPFADLMVPLFWLELNIPHLPSPIRGIVWAVLDLLPIVQQVLMWLFGILGVSMVGASALMVFYFPPEHRLEDPFGNRIGYSPILVLPMAQHFKPDLRISK